MATTLALVYQSPTHIRYLVTADAMGGAVTLANDAGATPDLQTDTLAGPLKAIATARANGIGTIPAGALTQAQARALLLADGSTNVGNANVPRAICTFTARAVGEAGCFVDANVDGAGDPVLSVTAAANVVGYLDIIALNTQQN